MSHWLVKSEPTSFSFGDLESAETDDVVGRGRNYAARNFLRAMKKGDRVFFYHSNAEPNAIVGICEVVREAYPDASQFDRKSEMHDPKSSRDDPRWSTVDLRAVRALPRPVALGELRGWRVSRRWSCCGRGAGSR